MQVVDFLQSHIEQIGLEQATFWVTTHPATLNWRQLNPSAAAKVANLESGIVFDNTALHPVKGALLSRFILDNQPLYQTGLVISMASRIVMVDGREMHLIMMNLHPDESLSFDDIIKTLREIIEGGFYVFRTDRYFHTYGTELLTREQWFGLNLRFLMTDILVSPRYIAHSLQRGYNLLRQTATCERKVAIPTLIHHEL